MKGWKTWLGSAITLGSGILSYLGYPDIGKPLMALGVGLGLVGIGHKVEKNAKKQSGDFEGKMKRIMSIMNEPPTSLRNGGRASVSIIIALLFATMAMSGLVSGCKKSDDMTQFAVETLAMSVGYELKNDFEWTPQADAYYQAIMDGNVSLDAAKAAETYLRTVTHPLIANRLVRLAGMVGFQLDDLGSVVNVDNVDIGLLKAAAQGFRLGMMLESQPDDETAMLSIRHAESISF